MTIRVHLHLLLAFAVLFASSFAVFHSNEHLALERKTPPSFASYFPNSSHHAHKGHAHHHHDVSNYQEEDALTLLCELCLVLTSVGSALPETRFSFLGKSNGISDLSSATSVVQSFTANYAPRAPPKQA